jgi:hypothetical protein
VPMPSMAIDTAVASGFGLKCDRYFIGKILRCGVVM